MDLSKLLKSRIESLSLMVAMAVVEEDDLTIYGVLEAIEKNIILNVLSMCNDNVSETARRVGLSRTALNYKVIQYKQQDNKDRLDNKEDIKSDNNENNQ